MARMNGYTKTMTPTQPEAGSGVLIGSREQEEIWRVLIEGYENVEIMAGAGTGKTTTGVEYCKRAQKELRVGYVAFNKHIADELQRRLTSCPNVEAMTYHSLGLRIVKANTSGRVQVDKHKVYEVLDTMKISVPEEKQKAVKYLVVKLTGLAKQYVVNERSELEYLVDHHGMDLNGFDDVVYDLVPRVLWRCKQDMKQVDFDDMIWLPVVLGLHGPKYDVLLIDEAQDTNRAQQYIALTSGKRVVVIGDPRQAIYGFRGSDNESMDRIAKELAKRPDGLVRLPLMETRRVPKSGVRLANKIVPELRAMDEAVEGKVRVVDVSGFQTEVKPMDMVLCRVNAPLVGNCYRLLKRGVKAVIRGKDVGEGLTKFLDTAIKRAEYSTELIKVLEAARDLTREAVLKFQSLPHGKGEQRAAAAQDQFDCLFELGVEVTTVTELKRVIDRLFADFDENGKPVDSVVLSTVHRGKGLEARRVYVLEPGLIPHPMARKEWEYEQERNIGYVAVTRHKEELVFVGGQSVLFPVEGYGSWVESNPLGIGDHEKSDELDDLGARVDDEPEDTGGWGAYSEG